MFSCPLPGFYILVVCRHSIRKFNSNIIPFFHFLKKKQCVYFRVFYLYLPTHKQGEKKFWPAQKLKQACLIAKRYRQIQASFCVKHTPKMSYKEKTTSTEKIYY